MNRDTDSDATGKLPRTCKRCREYNRRYLDRARRRQSTVQCDTTQPLQADLQEGQMTLHASDSIPMMESAPAPAIPDSPVAQEPSFVSPAHVQALETIDNTPNIQRIDEDTAMDSHNMHDMVLDNSEQNAPGNLQYVTLDNLECIPLENLHYNALHNVEDSPQLAEPAPATESYHKYQPVDTGSNLAAPYK